MSTIFFSISTHYRVPNITKIQQANYKKKTGINAYVQRAAIIVKKKKKDAVSSRKKGVDLRGRVDR